MKNKLYCRIHQQIYRMASYFVPWRFPEIFQGELAYENLADKLSQHKKILIVTDKALVELGLLTQLLNTLDKNHIAYAVYDKILPNPTIANVEEALIAFHHNDCSAIIGFGGGSPIDCGKIVAARVARPNKAVTRMMGIQKIRKKLIPLIAIPTTAGTGSEVTIAAVITDDQTHQKYAVSDMCLMPKYILMDYTLTYKLPPFITATTGMDALTHAIEAFIGKANTKQTKLDALKAITLVHENLYIAYQDGENEKARKSMLFASFYGGRAFTRAYVGNVHAMAHTLGGTYHIAHGYANAVALPVVLRAYGNKVGKKLAMIADHIGLSEDKDSVSQKSEKLIHWIEGMNESMNIPMYITEIKKEDIPMMAKKAYIEANPAYPVPDIWSMAQFQDVFIKLGGKDNV